MKNVWAVAVIVALVVVAYVEWPTMVVPKPLADHNPWPKDNYYYSHCSIAGLYYCMSYWWMVATVNPAMIVGRPTIAVVAVAHTMI